MKKILTENFEFLTFDKNNIKHIETAYLIQDDPVFSNYFGYMEDYFEVIDSDQVDLSGNYITYLNNEIVGFVTLYDYYTHANLDYGLLEKYRGYRLEKSSLAVSMIKEFSNEVFKRTKELEYFKAFINNYNVKSIEAAKRAGFVFFKESVLNSSEYRKYRSL